METAILHSLPCSSPRFIPISHSLFFCVHSFFSQPLYHYMCTSNKGNNCSALSKSCLHFIQHFLYKLSLLIWAENILWTDCYCIQSHLDSILDQSLSFLKARTLKHAQMMCASVFEVWGWRAIGEGWCRHGAECQLCQIAPWWNHLRGLKALSTDSCSLCSTQSNQQGASCTGRTGYSDI